MANEGKPLDPNVAALGNELNRRYQLALDGAVRVCLQPKPKWLPAWVWHRIVGRLIRVEMLQPTLRMEEA